MAAAKRKVTSSPPTVLASGMFQDGGVGAQGRESVAKPIASRLNQVVPRGLLPPQTPDACVRTSSTSPNLGGIVEPGQRLKRSRARQSSETTSPCPPKTMDDGSIRRLGPNPTFREKAHTSTARPQGQTNRRQGHGTPPSVGANPKAVRCRCPRARIAPPLPKVAGDLGDNSSGSNARFEKLIITDAMHAFFRGGKRQPEPIRQNTFRSGQFRVTRDWRRRGSQHGLHLTSRSHCPS